MEPPEYRANIAEVLITEDEIRAKVAELADRISSDYRRGQLVLVGVLNGAAVFMADLMRCLSIPVEIDFVGVASYGDGTTSSGQCTLTKDVTQGLEGKHVLVVEDIVDTGRTVAALVDCLKAKGATSVAVCALLDKPSRREVDLCLDYVGFEIPDRFVVGYGLDFAQHYRSLSYIAVLRPEAYAPDQVSAASPNT